MIDPASEALAAELEWAAAGAALEVESLRSRIAELDRTCRERDDVISELKTHVAVTQHTADERARLIATLTAAIERERVAGADVRRGLISQRDAAVQSALETANAHASSLLQREGNSDELTRICEERLTLINELQNACDERLALIEELQRTCEERMTVIEKVSAEAERRSALLADITAALEAKRQELDELRPLVHRPS